MLVRYFAAAEAAAGTAEEKIEHDGALTLDGLVALLAERHPLRPGAASPSLERVLSRSSFLLDEVSIRTRDTPLPVDGVLDVLPPFAGG